MEVMKKYKISAQYLKNYSCWAQTHSCIRSEYHYSKFNFGITVVQFLKQISSIRLKQEKKMIHFCNIFISPLCCLLWPVTAILLFIM